MTEKLFGGMLGMSVSVTVLVLRWRCNITLDTSSVILGMGLSCLLIVLVMSTVYRLRHDLWHSARLSTDVTALQPSSKARCGSSQMWCEWRCATEHRCGIVVSNYVREWFVAVANDDDDKDDAVPPARF